MFYAETSFHISSPNSPLVIPMKPKAKEILVTLSDAISLPFSCRKNVG
jgi:hypothetical protein